MPTATLHAARSLPTRTPVLSAVDVALRALPTAVMPALTFVVVERRRPCLA